MELDPHAFLPGDAVLVVKPSLETTARKAAAVDGKVGFDGAQRQSAPGNQGLEDRSEVRVLVKGRHLHAGDGAGNVAALVSFAQVRRKPPAAEGAVDLVGHCENRVLDRVRPLAPDAFPARFGNAAAKVVQENLKPFLLESLRFVVGGPN